MKVWSRMLQHQTTLTQRTFQHHQETTQVMVPSLFDIQDSEFTNFNSFCKWFFTLTNTSLNSYFVVAMVMVQHKSECTFYLLNIHLLFK